MKQTAGFRSLMAGVAIIVACAACCALPLLLGAGAAGVVSGIVAEFGNINPWLVGSLVATMIALAGAFWFAKRRRR